MEDIKAAFGVEAKYMYIQKYNHMYDFVALSIISTKSVECIPT